MPDDQQDQTPPAPPPTRAASPEPELDTPGAWYAPAPAISPRVASGSGWVSWTDFISQQSSGQEVRR